MANKLETLAKKVIGCEKCPRLREHCLKTAKEKRKSFLGETYWGKPIPGFGDPKAHLVMVGLAPAAHGANRTGRIFTGDRSGDWLFRALHRAGFANQAQSTHIGDGLKLRDAYVTCSVRCAPLDNKPTPQEFKNCAPFLYEDLDQFPDAKVFVVLGLIAFHALIGYLNQRGLVLKKSKMKFGHGARFELENGKTILCSYHPSQQNTFTGRLTEKMFDSIFTTARQIIRKKVNVRE